MGKWAAKRASRAASALLALGLAGGPVSAWAQGAPSAAASKAASASAAAGASKGTPASASKGGAAKERLASALQKLQGPDAETVRAGIDALRELKSAKASSALTERVRAGLPPALYDAALEALVALDARGAKPVIVELTQHRRGLVRARALRALGALERGRGGATQALMLAALQDPSDEARIAAAEALVRVGTQAALPALYDAYDRGTSAAILAIAQLASRKDLDALLARMPQGMVEPVEPALDALLEKNKLPPSAQLQLVRALAERATPSARRYLLKWLDRIKLQGNSKVKQELFEALKTLDEAQPQAPAPAAPEAAPPAAPAAAASGGRARAALAARGGAR